MSFITWFAMHHSSLSSTANCRGKYKTVDNGYINSKQINLDIITSCSDGWSKSCNVLIRVCIWQSVHTIAKTAVLMLLLLYLCHCSASNTHAAPSRFSEQGVVPGRQVQLTSVPPHGVTSPAAADWSAAGRDAAMTSPAAADWSVAGHAAAMTSPAPC